ncbi:lactoferrin/transferrin family TonB-dependent receptor [Moraxella haemolytica]|uniref:lactoferrin/transferrin family TonB-dependent receptor n=1 Tax=Moraxella haemolytica TaxID=2904119 RepID=UPI0025432A38|nr:lactoferrin/transferrin family TonB-dependent receptor [Moraxella sp. ZY171148]WII95769.1 lactoferrin/transferrin family TonB-dependent receptor [Moraxella sp. ZY171148]
MNHNELKVRYRLLFLAVSMAMCGTPAFADENDDPSVELEALNAVIKRQATRKTNEITGLGKVVKRTEDINKEMVLGIRDLTRYDPGISVVEQGRGATSGYAMRGVDKNRVAIVVDGLSQAQSYRSIQTQAGSGAINEVEYENIKSIELSKGSSSAEYGSGALGGAVGLTTKDSSDVIKEGQSWGLDTKTAYSSKNDQWIQSVAGAFKMGKFDNLLIYTHKEGKEIKGHKAIDEYLHSYQPLEGYFDRYDLRKPDTYGRSYYLVKDDCPTLDCTPLPFASINSDVLPIRTSPALSSKEQEQADKIRYPTRTASTKDYTGIDRVHANPMDYKSQSIFYKAGYDVSDVHRLGMVIEHTKQHYNIQDMTLPAYYTKADIPKGVDLTQGSINAETGLAVGNSGIVDVADNPLSGLVFNKGESGRYGARYSRTRFFDEEHQKKRFGVSYEFKSPSQTGLIDKALLSLDHQTIGVDSTVYLQRCSDYPNMSRCQASVDKPWSWSGREFNQYEEKLKLAQLNLQKNFELGKSKHRFQTLIGIGDVKSTLERGALAYSYASGGYNNEYKQGHNGSYDKPRIYKRVPVTLQSAITCNNESTDNNNCEPRIITGKHSFMALRDHIALGDKVDLGLGVRYDNHRFSTDDDWTAVDNYKNWSYNAGFTVHPKDYLALSYRYSNGFRVPAFYEMYGIRVGASGKDNDIADKDYKNRIAPRPEKSTNHEFGVGLQGRFGTIETSYFRNHYKDLIAKGNRRGQYTLSDYYNIQNITLEGINVLGKIDWYGVYDKLPDGLYSNLAYNRVKVKDRHIYDGYTMTTDPILDAIQPSRVVAGIGYDAPSGKWGFNHSLTYSKAKNPDELTGSAYYGHEIAIAVPSKRSRSWYTHDLTGYYMPHDNITLRAGVYNLMNYKYSTWESVRQSSINAVNQDVGTSHARYAAPGRNYTLALEMKF